MQPYRLSLLAPGISTLGCVIGSRTDSAVMDLLRTIVRDLSVRFPSRNGCDPPSLHGAAELLESKLKSLEFDVESIWYSDGTSMVRNLVIRHPGSDPAAPAIVVGAHYDTVLETPGADDNASGVAGVVELAMRFKGISTHHPIHFVLFPHEEPPYFFTSAMGSRHYASSLRREKIPVMFMMALEMIAYASADLLQRYPFPLMRILGGYPREADFVSVVGNLRSMPKTLALCRAMRRAGSVRVESLSAPGFLPPLFLSDHSSFWKYGFPAAMITDTAFLRNPHYHLPTDTIETLNFDFLERVVTALEAGIVALDAER
jgi:Zn-dependent M28 family amino/carboxypeptidase